MKGLFQAILASFYSGRFYADLAHKGRGMGMEFMVVLAVVQMFLAAVALGSGYPAIDEAMKKIPALASTLPVVTSKDGKLSIDKPVPYEIKIGKDSSEKIVIDTNYKIDDVDALTRAMKEQHIIIFVTADLFAAFKDKEQTLEIRSLKDMQPFTVTHEDWMKLADKIQTWGMSMLFGFLFVSAAFGLLFFNFMAAFFSAMAVKIVSAFVRADLEFDTAMRLASAARIPANVMALLPLNILIPESQGWMPWLLWAGYMVFATVASKQKTPAL